MSVLAAPGDVTAAELHALAAGRLALRRDDVARFRLTGGGRVACLQGLVTCDVAQTEGRTRLFGALLTSKGMIVAPLWIGLREESIEIETPAAAAPALAAVFQRTLPPRLCRWTDETADTASVGLYGPAAASFPGALPAVVRGLPGFEAVIPAADAAAWLARAAADGAVPASAALVAQARIEAGIPALGAEIDDKTLPQEVRYEALGAVSYTKGCYIGQETVARLHFRGHANRRLVSVDLPGAPAALPQPLTLGGAPAGRLTSAAWSPSLERWIGLAVVRREAADGATLAGADPAYTVTVRDERWVRPA
jgi:tRNA-modifying protein YgfZ